MAGTAASRMSSSSFTAMRRAWKVRLAGCPPVAPAATGTAERITSTRRPVVSMGASARARTMARAMGPAKRSSPSRRMIRRSSCSSSSATSVAAERSAVSSMRMSSGAS